MGHAYRPGNGMKIQLVRHKTRGQKTHSSPHSEICLSTTLALDAQGKSKGQTEFAPLYHMPARICHPTGFTPAQEGKTTWGEPAGCPDVPMGSVT